SLLGSHFDWASRGTCGRIINVATASRDVDSTDASPPSPRRTSSAIAGRLSRNASGAGPGSSILVKRVLLEPGLRNSFVRSRQPGFGDQVMELLSIEAHEIRDPHQHRWIAVEMRRGEE